MKRFGVIALVAVVACGRSAADHEALGDQEYAAGSYQDALAEYQLGLKANPENSGLHAKTGAAALHTGNAGLAVVEYRALGVSDRSRVDEAADGLERAARLAQLTQDHATLASAVGALRALAPGRPLGQYARAALGDALTRGDAGDALNLLPIAIATTGDPVVADSLLFLYGQAQARNKACDTASEAFNAVLERKHNRNVEDDARAGLAACDLVTAQNLLAQGKPVDAEPWFSRATAPEAAADVSRMAWIGLGDVRLAQGDVPGALEAYQSALTGAAPGDSISVMAQSKIAALGRATTPPDSHR